MTVNTLTDEALDVIFRSARSANAWQPAPVSDDLLHKIYETMKFGPTAANSCPLRVLFVKSETAKARLKPALDSGNIEKSMAAPVVAIFAHDMAFYEKLGKLFPHAPGARSWFEGNDRLIAEVTLRNSSLQAAYFMIAARAHGLDCGPMSGFNNQIVDDEFFKGTSWKSNFICGLGHIDNAKTFPRSPRLEFDEACKII